ncbi:hypothetical protein DFJ74DRAFT_522626 [Hyaloraphidium curvatum]|nr:hypothetical protein DFJ74DRAFT_522626 [Hyaloraphidium curvatum]
MGDFEALFLMVGRHVLAITRVETKSVWELSAAAVPWILRPAQEESEPRIAFKRPPDSESFYPLKSPHAAASMPRAAKPKASPTKKAPRRVADPLAPPRNQMKTNCHTGAEPCPEHTIIDEPQNREDRRAYFVQEVAPLTVSIVEQQEVKHGQNHCRFRNTMLGPDGMTCTRCNRTFSTKFNAQCHEICPSNHYRCVCCGQGFTTLSNFLKHCKTTYHTNARAGWTVYPYGMGPGDFVPGGEEVHEAEYAEEEVGYAEGYGGAEIGYYDTEAQGGEEGPAQSGSMAALLQAAALNEDEEEEAQEVQSLGEQDHEVVVEPAADSPDPLAAAPEFAVPAKPARGKKAKKAAEADPPPAATFSKEFGGYMDVPKLRTDLSIEGQ